MQETKNAETDAQKETIETHVINAREKIAKTY